MLSKDVRVDVAKVVREYLSNGDVARENANMNRGPSGMLMAVGNEGLKRLTLKEMAECGFERLVEWHTRGMLHIHDLGLGVEVPYCFTGDTQVRMADGTSMSFHEMIESDQSTFEVYSFDMGHIPSIKQAINVRKTREAAKIVEVYLSNGKTFRCTPDHKLLTGFWLWISVEELASLKCPVRLCSFDDINLYLEKVVELDEVADVYCMTVPETECFVLDCGVIAHNCAGHSLPNLLSAGLSSGNVSGPAKHIETAINHMVNYIGENSNDYSGAQALNGVDTYLAPYAYKAYLDYKVAGCAPSVAFKLAKKKISQAIQNFIFHLNYNTRYGNQRPFSNITLDITIPDDLKDQLAMVGGRPITDYYDYTDAGIRVNNHTYGEMHEWQRLVTDAFLDVFIAGDAIGQGFTFPVLTLNIDSGFFSHPCLDKICMLTAKYGTPFFQNFINGVGGGKNLSTGDVRAMCCRLSLDLKEIANKTGGLFGNSDNTGSLQVVTLSLPFLAREAKEQGISLFDLLDIVMEEIKTEMIWKREQVNHALDNGFMRLSKQFLPHGFNTFFTTVGFIGLWECVSITLENEKSLLTEEGVALGENILQHMTNKTRKWMEETGYLFNVEETPAESASYKLAKKALNVYPDIDHRGLKKAPYFTNGCNIPVEMQDDVALVMEVRDRLQIIPTGGTATHFYVGEAWSVEDVKEFIRATCETRIPYFSISTIYSICPICGYHVGAHDFCPNEHTEDQIAELRRKHPYMIVDEKGDEGNAS